MTLLELLEQVREEKVTVPYKGVWYQTFLKLSLYIYGVKPNYKIIKDEYYRTDSQRNDPEAEAYTKIYDNDIFSRYPHDTSPQLNFRKSIAAVDDMKSLTDKFFEQSTSIIFQGNNFKVETTDPKLMKWLETVRVEGFSFNEWVKKVLYPRMMVDPNAWLAVLESHTEELLQSEPALPVPVITLSKDVSFISSGATAVITNQFALDAQEQILHREYKPESFVTYRHSIGEVPAMQLGGKHVKWLIWQSFIQSFVGIANSYLQEKSDVAISKKVLAPRLQIIESDCPACNGTGFEEREDGRVKCGECVKGKITLNLGDVVGVPESRVTMDDKVINLQRYQYNTPDATYIEVLSKDADKEFARAEKALCIYRKETAAVESGDNLSKQFEEKKIFFQDISERMYYLINETLKYVSMFLNYNNGNPKPAVFTVHKPIDFDLSTVDDLITQYKAEKSNGMPSMVINSTERNYVKKAFGDNNLILRKVDFLQLYDPFYGVDISNRGAVDPFDVFTHNYLAYFLELYIRKVTPEVFMTTPFDKVWEALKVDIQTKADAMPSIL